MLRETLLITVSQSGDINLLRRPDALITSRSETGKVFRHLPPSLMRVQIGFYDQYRRDVERRNVQ